jgi:predicted ribosome quality control (RQC) complex YloA/Tae2 family protein
VDQVTIQEVVNEVSPQLEGRFLGKIFQLSPVSLAIDFGLRHGTYLFVSVDPGAPRTYLIKSRLKDLEKAATAPSQFVQAVRARLSGAVVEKVEKVESDRIVRFSLVGTDELGKTDTKTLVLQLTGRSANLFLCDANGTIISSLRPAKGAGQEVGHPYQPPQTKTARVEEKRPNLETLDSISVALDTYFLRYENEQAFQSLANNLRGQVRGELRQKAKLRENLEKDLSTHGDPEEHKRLGDLLLANIAAAKREGSTVTIRDFYSEGEPTIELELDENTSLQEEAVRYFNRYAKAKRAREEIMSRQASLTEEMKALEEKHAAIERAIEQHDEESLQKFVAPEGKRRQREKSSTTPGIRMYKSSDSYEILVGRAARDNDNLTFRIAGPNDLWLHAADYPGSHVVVRKTNRKEIPHRTIVEAAQLAARFSQASKDSKVVVHYTPRKFLSKPRGAAPGLVRMSSFKTILVEPKESVERI